jgi:hypothetical protein
MLPTPAIKLFNLGSAKKRQPVDLGPTIRPAKSVDLMPATISGGSARGKNPEYEESQAEKIDSILAADMFV